MSPADEAGLPGIVLAAAREFNAGRYFEAHEEIEERLEEVPDAWWPFFLGLLQVAVGYHKLASGNDGAAGMLGRGLEKLAPFADDSLGIDLGALRRRAELDRARLESHDGTTPLASLATDPPRLLPVVPR